MSSAIAAWDARAPRRVAAAAIAAVLQGVFYWLILHEAVAPTVQQSSAPLHVTIFETARRLRPVIRPPKQLQPERPRRPATKSEARSLPAARPILLPRAGQPVAHPAVDWQQALQGEVRAQESASLPGKVRFGFPQRTGPLPAAPRFGWDYAHTHRVEQLPEGGLLINLNDRCAVVLYVVMPFPVCKIGHIPTDGGLFDHLRDRRDDRPDGLP